MPSKTRVFLFIVESKIIKKTKVLKKIVLNLDLIRDACAICKKYVHNNLLDTLG